MFFNSLKDKCEFYRSLTDYKLMPNSYVLVMVDGHRFSKLIKNKFDKPFDQMFINMMNETAKYLCEQIQGAKFAYVQSDEISILITDFDTPKTDSYFGFRLCKMQSIIASMASVKFNQVYYNTVKDNMLNKFKEMKEPPLCVFDCKVWTVPNANDAYAWFLYRQTDCIRNSKQQTAQAYLPHKSLVGLNADEQIEKTYLHCGVNWNDFYPDLKYGRFVKKEEKDMETDLPNGQHIEFKRNVWSVIPANDLKIDNSQIRTLI